MMARGPAELAAVNAWTGDFPQAPDRPAHGPGEKLLVGAFLPWGDRGWGPGSSALGRTNLSKFHVLRYAFLPRYVSSQIVVPNGEVGCGRG